MDYNIYIHDKTSGQQKATQPRSNGSSNTSPKSESSEQNNTEQGLAKAAQKSNVGKVALAVYVAAKITKQAVETITPFVTKETGDYRFSVAWNNSWNTLKSFLGYFNFSTQIREMSYYQEIMLVNKRQEQQRLLVGDSYINAMSRTY